MSLSLSFFSPKCLPLACQDEAEWYSLIFWKCWVCVQQDLFAWSPNCFVSFGCRRSSFWHTLLKWITDWGITKDDINKYSTVYWKFFSWVSDCLHSLFWWGPCGEGLERGYVVLVCVLTKQCADGSTESRCSESCLSDLSDEFLAPISYTTKLLSKSHMHGYSSKKLLLNITIVLRNVVYLSIQQFALCSRSFICSGAHVGCLEPGSWGQGEECLCDP